MNNNIRYPSRKQTFTTCLGLLLLLMPFWLIAQGDENDHEASGHKWRIGLAMINSHVPAIEDSKQRAIIPTWGLDIDYKITNKWVLGLIFDVELQSYRVAYGDVVDLERQFPVTLGLGIIYELTHNISFGVGFAREFETHENFNMVFYQGMYTFRLPNGFDISPGLVYNTRIDAFDTYSFNLAVGKSF